MFMVSSPVRPGYLVRLLIFLMLLVGMNSHGEEGHALRAFLCEQACESMCLRQECHLILAKPLGCS